MIDKVYKVIDDIDSNSIVKRLYTLKEEIKNDETASFLIKRFQEAKSIYEKEKDSKLFIEAKNNMLKNELIKEYITFQNEINLITLHINNRLKMLTKGIINKK